MKRLMYLILAFCLVLSGCTTTGERIKEPVTFYYVRDNYQKDMEPAIDSEVREASGHKGDLAYLLALYSMGPATEALQSPLPRNTKIELLEHSEEGVVLQLSNHAETMTDADFTLACACICLTCFELSGVPKVTVVCGETSITMQKDMLMLNTITPYQQEETK